MLNVKLTDENCDWIHSSFMHRIELLGEWLELDGPGQNGADDMREELRCAEPIVAALRKAGYTTKAEAARGAN